MTLDNMLPVYEKDCAEKVLSCLFSILVVFDFALKLLVDLGGWLHTEMVCLPEDGHQYVY